MNAVEVSTLVYAPQEAIYEFLLDFTGYGKYSAYIDGIERTGDGGPGTRYAITVSWWKLEYTANSEVTETSPPTRIDWRLVGGISAHGHWRIESVADDGHRSDGETPARGGTDGNGRDHSGAEENGTDGNRAGGGQGAGDGHRVVLHIEYDPSSVSGADLSLPAFVPLDAVVDRVAPHVQSEAESIVEDVVAELEGERRSVELTVHQGPDVV